MALPIDPPIWTGELEGTGGAIGAQADDFVVDEVPLYSPSGAGEHLYLKVRKRERTTRELIRAIADATGVPTSEVGNAGMKDKHAVTTQWLSVPARSVTSPESLVLGDGFEVLEVARHTNKLRTGHLSGNRFRIRIVGVNERAEPAARAILAEIEERWLPNYFGSQRFGFGGDNLDRAIAWASGSGGRGRVPPFERKLFSSVLQSEVFNRYVVARLGEGLALPIPGEVVRLEGSRALFVVEDPEQEASRWRARDIHPTGPLFGPKMKEPRGRAQELERCAVGAVALSPEALAKVARSADGTRRDVLVRPADVDLMVDGPDSLVISFFLPAGSYGTLLVRELTRGPFLGDAR